jgi:hypothetical protein
MPCDGSEKPFDKYVSGVGTPSQGYSNLRELVSQKHMFVNQHKVLFFLMAQAL